MTTPRIKGLSQAHTIGRLAKATGVTVETVRYYQRRGLLQEPNRQPGTHRQYPAAALERLGLIKRAQHFGFSLDEIQQLIGLADDNDGTKVLAIAEARRRAMRERAQQLE